MKRPPLVFVNAYGLGFGRSRSRSIYAGSKRRFSDYYRYVCLRCGWTFASGKHKRHRLAECDQIRRERRADAGVNRYALQNLYGVA
jgi:hypothetical protein